VAWRIETYEGEEKSYFIELLRF